MYICTYQQLLHTGCTVYKSRETFTDNYKHWYRNEARGVAGLGFKKFCLLYHEDYHNYVTGFWRTDQIVTLSLFHFIGPANSYTYTLPIHSSIAGLADWSTFLERVLPTMWIHNWNSGTHGGYYMEGMGLKLTSVVVRHLLSPLSMIETMDGTSWTHN